jgi:REP-associated tyrosine transposase
VVMPNHVHGIIILHDRAAIPSPPVGAQHAAPLPSPVRSRPNVTPGSLGAIVRSYKSAVTRAIVQRCGGALRIWQRNYFEHVIRDEADWNRIDSYIDSNALNWEKDKENPMCR